MGSRRIGVEVGIHVREGEGFEGDEGGGEVVVVVDMLDYIYCWKGRGRCFAE